MSPVTHFLLGWVVAAAPSGLNHRERVWITAAAVLPDLDGLGLVAGWVVGGEGTAISWYQEYHHLAGHNLWFALALGGVGAWLAQRRLLVGTLALLSVQIHYLADLLGSRGGTPEDLWGIPYLYPFSDHVWVWRGQWELVSWQNTTVTALLLAATFLVAIRRGYSPLGLFSGHADGVLVATLRARFGSPAANRALPP